MCNLVEKVSFLEVCGYKVAVKRDDIYYSPTTGIEYKLGDVEIPKKQINVIDTIVNDLLEEDSPAYAPNMIGRTCIFINLENAKDQLEHWASYTSERLVLLKLTISKDIMMGKYGTGFVFAGKRIESLDEVK